jgi:hypothetical protein
VETLPGKDPATRFACMLGGRSRICRRESVDRMSNGSRPARSGESRRRAEHGRAPQRLRSIRCGVASRGSVRSIRAGVAVHPRGAHYRRDDRVIGLELSEAIEQVVDRHVVWQRSYCPGPARAWPRQPGWHHGIADASWRSPHRRRWSKAGTSHPGCADCRVNLLSSASILDSSSNAS